MRTTVVHLIGSLDRGGAEMVALDLCRRIPATEVQQVFVCLSGRAGSLADAFEATGAIVEPARFGSPIDAGRIVRAAIRNHRPHAIVSHVSLASGWLLATAWAMRVPIRIARFHSEGDGRGDGLVRRVYRIVGRTLTVASASRIVAVSEASLRFAIGRWAPMLPPDRATVIGNGVDTERFSPGPATNRSTPRVIHVGRASPEKNRGALVPIFRALESKHRTAWWVVGPGDPSDLGAIPDDRFEVLGDRSDVADLLRESDALVLPSSREGLPGVILEALATGVPVVASELDTLRELAARLPGIALVPVRASPERWAETIADALRIGPSESSSIRAAVLDSDYTLERSVHDWRGLFEHG